MSKREIYGKTKVNDTFLRYIVTMVAKHKVVMFEYLGRTYRIEEVFEESTFED